MNRNDYLQQASQWKGADTTAIELARRLRTTFDIEEASEQLVKTRTAAKLAESFWYRIAGCFLSAIVGVIIAAVVLTNYYELHLLDTTAVLLHAAGTFSLVAMVGCLHRSSNIFDDVYTSDTQLKLIQPIAGTEQCREALDYFKEDYPAVKAWRDLAIAERGQLYGFDVSVLRSLHGVAELAALEASQQKLIDEACREIHGLSLGAITP